MKKLYVLLIAISMLSVMLSSCGLLSDNLSKKEIFKLVKENETLLLECISENNFEKASAIKGIRKIEVGEIIDFYCGGAGFGPETSYYGFYYTTDENMTAIWCAGGSVTADGKGYSWAEEDGDNRYYTEKICDSFYYYEAHF